jgi:hypothetical protein
MDVTEKLGRACTALDLADHAYVNDDTLENSGTTYEMKRAFSDSPPTNPRSRATATVLERRTMPHTPVIIFLYKAVWFNPLGYAVIPA